MTLSITIKNVTQHCTPQYSKLMLSAFKLNLAKPIMMSVIMLNVIQLSVIILSVVAPPGEQETSSFLIIVMIPRLLMTFGQQTFG
jgi:hypothetical protein